MTANSRVTRGTTVLAVYVALQLGSVVLGIAISHKPAATSGSVMALEDAPKLPIDITEAF
jgi:type II secretory pathway component PulJ